MKQGYACQRPKHNCYEENTSYTDFDLPNSPTTEQNIESCQLKCYITEACKYWIWNKAKSRCFLKSEKHEENRSYHHDFITSAKHCFKCAVWGFQYPGNDLPNMPLLITKSAMDCQMICQKNNDCKYWGLIGKECYLKNGKNEAGKTPTPNSANGPKYC